MLFMKVVEPEPEQEQEQEQEAVPKMDAGFVDRVFKFMGFADGIDTTTDVPISHVLSAIAQSHTLSVADQYSATMEMQVSFAESASWTTPSKIGSVLRKIAASVGVTIGTRLVIRKYPASRVYFLQC
jgi:hypothetical protein